MGSCNVHCCFWSIKSQAPAPFLQIQGAHAWRSISKASTGSAYQLSQLPCRPMYMYHWLERSTRKFTQIQFRGCGTESSCLGKEQLLPSVALMMVVAPGSMQGPCQHCCQMSAARHNSASSQEAAKPPVAGLLQQQQQRLAAVYCAFSACARALASSAFFFLGSR